MKVFIRKKNGMIEGPISVRELHELVTNGETDKNDRVAPEGSSDWVNVTQFLTDSGYTSNPIATPLKRVIAFLADLLMLFAIIFISFVVFRQAPWTFPNHWDEKKQLLLSVILWQTAIAIMQASQLQASPGKILLSLMVVNENNTRLSYLQSLARQLALLASFLVPIFLLMPFVTKLRKSAHDVVVKTSVVEQ